VLPPAHGGHGMEAGKWGPALLIGIIALAAADEEYVI
jgi:hypothetical protein